MINDGSDGFQVGCEGSRHSEKAMGFPSETCSTVSLEKLCASNTSYVQSSCNVDKCST